MNWRQIHQDSTVVDLHTHPSLKATILGSNLSKDNGGWILKLFERRFYPFSNRVTFPKLNRGGVNVLLSTAYVLEQGWIDDISLIKWLFRLFPGIRKTVVDPTYFDATNNMLDEMEKQIVSYNFVATDEDRHIRLALSVNELISGIEAGDLCVVHSIEGAHSLQGVEAGKTIDDDIMSHPDSIEEELLSNLDHFFKRGVAYLTLAHFYPNLVAYPVFPYPEYAQSHLNLNKIWDRWDMTLGLTPLGEKVVEKMLDLGMLIDIVHCTPNGRRRIMDIASHHNKKNCIIASHTGAFSINRNPYNLTDDEIRWIGDNGGVVGTIFMNYWLSPVDSGMGLKYIEQTIGHIIDVGGIDAVGIGTDYDGFTDPPDELVDVSQLPRLTQYLASVGYTEKQLQNILGGNALRVLKEGWGKKQ